MNLLQCMLIAIILMSVNLCLVYGYGNRDGKHFDAAETTTTEKDINWFGSGTTTPKDGTLNTMKTTTKSPNTWGSDTTTSKSGSLNTATTTTTAAASATTTAAPNTRTSNTGSSSNGASNVGTTTTVAAKSLETTTGKPTTTTQKTTTKIPSTTSKPSLTAKPSGTTSPPKTTAKTTKSSGNKTKRPTKSTGGKRTTKRSGKNDDWRGDWTTARPKNTKMKPRKANQKGFPGPLRSPGSKAFNDMLENGCNEEGKPDADKMGEHLSTLGPKEAATACMMIDPFLMNGMV